MSVCRYTLPEPDSLWNAVWAPGPGAGPGAGALATELNLSSASLQLPTTAIIEAFWPRGEDGARVCGAQACPLVYEAFEYDSRPKTLAQCKSLGRYQKYYSYARTFSNNTLLYTSRLGG